MQTITLDLQRKSILTPLKAKQNDRYSRFFKVVLLDGSTTFSIPLGAALTLRYIAPSGCGWYDTITEIDGKKTHNAFAFSGNEVTVEIAEAVLTLPGSGTLCLQIYTAAGYRIGTWNIPIEIEADPCSDQNVVASDYYNVLTAQVAQTLQYKNDAASSAQAAAASAALAQQISQQNKGWYADAAALRAAHPTGQNGDWAIVGGAIDTIWVWDADTTDWKNTNQQTEMSNYYTKSQADALFLAKTALLDLTHPVGSIYTSTVATEPSTLFGGVWQRIKDTFILAAGDTYTAGQTGGEANNTLTTDNIPAHKHPTGGYATSVGSGSVYYATVQAPAQYGTGYTGEAGGGQPHNNMPPYLTAYVWKRTA